MIRRLATITALSAGLVAISLIPQPARAWAPNMLGGTVEALRQHGWDVCEPVISQLPGDVAEDGTYADAGTPAMFDACEIRFAVGIDADQLDWIAWHETCHLATMDAIHADSAHEQMEDPYHKHPLFTACLDQGPAERGGY